MDELSKLVGKPKYRRDDSETETIFKSMLEGEGMRARLADEKGMRPVLPAKFVAYLDEISGETGKTLP